MGVIQIQVTLVRLGLQKMVDRVMEAESRVSVLEDTIKVLETTVQRLSTMTGTLELRAEDAENRA